MVPFTITTCASALLLFWLEPLFARQVLPILGGAPSVWNTALVFYQAVLLVGYAWAHLLGRLPLRAQVAAQALLLGAGALLLPVGPARGWSPPALGPPAPWLLALLAVSIGAPLWAVCAHSPLLQRWYAATRGPSARDPYFLYAASNAGSLVALLAYPLVVERFVPLAAQAWWWSCGYALVALAVVACGIAAVRTPPAAPDTVAPSEADAPPVSWRSRFGWLFLAFVPSALLVAVTTHLTTDVASAPLLWVVPLALYLATFIHAFARRPPLAQRWLVKAQVYSLVLVALVAPLNGFWISLPLALLNFVICSLVAHGELAAQRPPPARLTEYYLWLSLGGALGGIFSSLVAPVVFSSVAEYPIGLVLACLARPGEAGDSGRRARMFDVALPIGALVVALALVPLGDRVLAGPPPLGWGLALIALCFVAFALQDRRARFALAMAAALVLPRLARPDDASLWRGRSFFGVYRVVERDDPPQRALLHGTTLHGAQALAPELRREPQTYYAPEGPLGQIFKAQSEVLARARVGIVGLGTGASACYRQPGQQWTFYEIDPLIVSIARDARFFTYLADCAPDARVVLGDARLGLAHEPGDAAHRFDLLVLDAFSSDAIPLHLLTREALAIYAAHLAPDGLLLVHISNRHLDLEPVLAALAADGGWASRVENFHVPQRPKDRARIPSPAHWAVLARSAARLSFLAGDERWRALRTSGARPWTDDHVDLISSLRRLGGAAR